MPSFKSKNSKQLKVCKKYNSTLDGKHHDFTNEFFHNETERIPKLKEERTQLKVKIASIKVFTIEEIMDFKDRVIEINDTIKELKHKKEHYFLENSKYIFEYFENKKNIDNVEAKEKTQTQN